MRAAANRSERNLELTLAAIADQEEHIEDVEAKLSAEVASIAFVISPVVTWLYRSGPRWPMALADCAAAEMFGAFDAGIG